MIVNKFPFSKNPSFSDTNQLLDDEIFNPSNKNDIEKNLQTDNLQADNSLKDNLNQQEKNFIKKIFVHTKKNCCICVFSLTIATIMVLIYGK